MNTGELKVLQVKKKKKIAINAINCISFFLMGVFWKIPPKNDTKNECLFSFGEHSQVFNRKFLILESFRINYLKYYPFLFNMLIYNICYDVH